MTSAAADPILARFRLTSRGMEAGAIALLVFTPLAYGTVQPWSEATAELVVLVMAVTLVIAMLAAPAIRIDLPPGWIPGALFLALVTLQLVPLPVAVVRVLSPWSGSLYEAVATEVGSVGWAPLSLDAHATLREALKLFAVAACFTIVYNTRWERTQTTRVLWTMNAMGVLISVFGVVQRMTWNGRLYWIGPPAGYGDNFGPFVNRAHFAGLMLVAVPMALALVIAQPRASAGRWAPRRFADRVRRWNSREGGPERLIPWLVALMGGAVLISGSRGGALALVLALATMIVLGHRASGWRAVLPVAVGIALIGLAALWMRSEFVSDTVRRFADELGRPDESVRLRLWTDALGLWARAPLLGIGLGGFETGFPSVRSLRTPVTYTHAESDWVQLLTDTGFAGALLALAACGTVAVALLRRTRTGANPFERSLALGALGALAGTAVQGIANFSLPVMAIWLYLAVATALALRPGGER